MPNSIGRCRSSSWPRPGGRATRGRPRSCRRTPDDADDLFDAAYEDMTYRDSTDDGFEGDMLEGGQETGRLRAGRGSRADLRAADVSEHVGAVVEDGRRGRGHGRGGRRPRPGAWPAGWPRPRANHKRLLDLLSAVHRYRIPPPRGTQESLVEYDRRRGIKETLLEQIIAATVETGDAGRLIRAVMAAAAGRPAESDPWQRAVEETLRAVLRGDAAAVRRRWSGLLAVLARQPLLYVALARGGNPLRIVASRSLQAMLRRLLGLPAAAGPVGGNGPTDRNHPGDGDGPSGRPRRRHRVRPACSRSAARRSSAPWCWLPTTWRLPKGAARRGRRDAELIGCLEPDHRSPAPLLAGPQPRRAALRAGNRRRTRTAGGELKQFIERYGHDLFTQRFMKPGEPAGDPPPGRRRLPAIAAGGTGRRGAVPPAGRVGRAAAARRGRPLAHPRPGSGGGKLRRIRRLQQHHHPVRPRRNALHALGLPAAADQLRPRGLELAAGGAGPRGAGAGRSRRGGGKLARRRGRADRRHCRRAPASGSPG